jgi:hypothetical protein
MIPGPLILTVSQRGPRPGVYIGKIEGTGLSIRASRHPLVDTARALLLVGCDPKTLLIMRNAGSSVDRVTGQIGTILRKTVKKGPSPDIRPIREREPGSRGLRGRAPVRPNPDDAPR